ncbi:ATG5, partial [Symbiodinium pilosum]
VASLAEPDPLFSLVPRAAYLPFLFHDVLEHFKKSAVARMGQPYELWFDYNHIALKWHFPLGVLCDALVGKEVPVPLDLTVHFRGNSLMKELLPFSGMADLQRSVMNAFKQAIFLEVGSASRFMRLEKKEHMMLWDAILRSDIRSFSQVEERLMCGTLAECKSLAVRLHIWAPPQSDEVLLHKAGGDIVRAS